jgi:hypothetical protein
VKHLLIILFSILLLSSPVIGESERPETIVIPVGTLGDISESRKQILQNTLSQELTKYFRLVPQDKFEAAQEQAFEELEYEECTEDQCIMMIQELLQVENVISLQLVEEDGDSQLSLTWVGLEEKKVLTDFCEGCKTKELNSKIELLVRNMVQQISQVTKVDTEPEEKDIPSTTDTTTDDTKVDTEPEEKLDDTTESYTYKLRGIIGSGSSDKTEFSNISLHFVWEKLGIGLSDFYMKTASSAGQKYELHNQSLDFTYTYTDDYFVFEGAVGAWWGGWSVAGWWMWLVVGWQCSGPVVGGCAVGRCMIINVIINHFMKLCACHNPSTLLYVRAVGESPHKPPLVEHPQNMSFVNILPGLYKPTELRKPWFV